MSGISPRELAAERSRARQRRRVALLQEVCAAIAEHETKGAKRGLAIKEIARKFRGRSLGGGRSLTLSFKSAERFYYSFLKRGEAAFALRYVASRQEIDPLLLHLVTQTAIRHSKSVSEILTEAGAAMRRGGPSLGTIYRALPAKELNRFLHAERRLVAARKRLGEELLAIQKELAALRSAAEERFLTKGGVA